jgi:hypothetical protein
MYLRELSFQVLIREINKNNYIMPHLAKEFLYEYLDFYKFCTLLSIPETRLVPPEEPTETSAE